MSYIRTINSYHIKTAWNITAFVSCCKIIHCNLSYYLLLSVTDSFDCITVFFAASVFHFNEYNQIIILGNNINFTCFIAEIPFKNRISVISAGKSAKTPKTI